VRILQIGPVPPEVGGKNIGGVANHTWDLSRNLFMRGHKVAIISDNISCQRNLFSIEKEIPIYGISSSVDTNKILLMMKPNIWYRIFKAKNHIGSLLSWKKVVKNILSYKLAIDDFKPDIIHIHHLEIRFPFTYYAINKEIPLVTTVHSPSSVEFRDNQFSKQMMKLIYLNLKFSDNLIFVSQLSKTRFKRVLDKSLNNKRIWIILNPVNSKIYYPVDKKEARKYLGIDTDRPVILFVGNIHKRKGLNTLIDSISILRSKNIKVKLIIVGEGPDKDQIIDLIKEKKLSSEISIKGSVPSLIYYYNSSDLFVLPSLYESFGLVYIEAMLCGCPVIGTDNVPLEVIPNSSYGYRVQSNNPEELAKKIEISLSRDWNRDHIVKYARSFDWSVKINEFEKIYRFLIDE
jgi:teichuronic acid biosynthesis glycosyltransferase TuaC